ncbi:MAG: hypothetical protein ACRECX_00685 [Methyloceanibacter sp.]|uniref:hypothetical protein n=1 Tax=Methyloceanibacter sp. TaxID=1965321 RepID=UPI003D6C767E
MFSDKLARRRRIHRWAVVTAVSVLLVGLALIAVWAVQAFDMLAVTDAGSGPLVLAVLIALGGLLVLTLAAYIAVRAYGRFTEAP